MRILVAKASFLFGLLLPLLGGANPAECMCIPCPCEACEVRSAGQLNWVVMDREAGRITLIPNIRIIGSGEDFALLLPTPSLPEVSSVSDTLWDEALALTAPQGLGSGRNLSCGLEPTYDAAPASVGDVQIVRQTRVGAFIVTTLQAADPSLLVAWLNQNGFALTPADIDKLRPFVTRGWFFCAMRLDPQAAPLTPAWDLSIDPVVFTFEASRLEVPLSVLDINRQGVFPMTFFIVDDHRAALSGFRTLYANRISPGEYAAIQESYPALAGYLKRGSFLTRLDRTFTETTRMDESIFLTRYETDDEYRGTWDGWAAMEDSAPWFIWGLIAGLRRVRISPFQKRAGAPT